MAAACLSKPTACAMLPLFERKPRAQALAAGRMQRGIPAPLSAAWRERGPARNQWARSSLRRWQRFGPVGSLPWRVAPRSSSLSPLPRWETRQLTTAPACRFNGWSPDWAVFSPNALRPQFERGGQLAPLAERLQQPIENLLNECRLGSTPWPLRAWFTATSGRNASLVGLQGAVAAGTALRRCLSIRRVSGDREGIWHGRLSEGSPSLLQRL